MLSAEETRGKTMISWAMIEVDPSQLKQAVEGYAWSSPVDGSDRRRFYAVLHMGGIRSPLDAVRAAIVAEHRSSV